MLELSETAWHVPPWQIETEMSEIWWKRYLVWREAKAEAKHDQDMTNEQVAWLQKQRG